VGAEPARHLPETVGGIHLLPKVLDAASRFRAAPSEEEMKELRVRQEMTPIFV